MTHLHLMKTLLLACLLSGIALAQTTCATIDFETVPGDSVSEGLLISEQYLDSLGISFVLEDSTLPRLAEVGSPITAFESNTGDDAPGPNQGGGQFFLTDDGVLSGLMSSPLIVTFVGGVDSASGVIYDIDFDESFLIQGRDAADSVLVEITIQAGDSGTGDGIATRWQFARPTPDIFSIRFSGTRAAAGAFGLGFDDFTTCALARSTSVAEMKRPYLSLFPNPAPGRFTVQSSQAAIQSLALYDLTGRRLPAKISHDRHAAQVRCDHHGLVVVQIETERGMRREKVWLE
jgi:hypothetical protein